MCVPRAPQRAPAGPRPYRRERSGGFRAIRTSGTRGPSPCAGLRRSLIGAVAMTALFILWQVLFQTLHGDWGATGSSLLVYEPDKQWWARSGPL